MTTRSRPSRMPRAAPTEAPGRDAENVGRDEGVAEQRLIGRPGRSHGGPYRDGSQHAPAAHGEDDGRPRRRPPMVRAAEMAPQYGGEVGGRDWETPDREGKEDRAEEGGERERKAEDAPTHAGGRGVRVARRASSCASDGGRW